MIAANALKHESMSSALNAPRSAEEITFFKADRVTEAFKKGDVLVNKGDYMVHASHRDSNGMAEVHTEDTDIIYVLEGSATFVTGGKVRSYGLEMCRSRLRTFVPAIMTTFDPDTGEQDLDVLRPRPAEVQWPPRIKQLCPLPWPDWGR